MTTIIWYNTEKGIYDFGSLEEFQLVGKEFDLIAAEEFESASLKTVSNITLKLNKSLRLLVA